MSDRLYWLLRNLLHPLNWLCFNCFMAHVDQCRDIQHGDVWNCKAGDHWRRAK